MVGHQPLDRAPRGLDPLAPQLLPHAPRPVALVVLAVHAADLRSSRSLGAPRADGSPLAR